MKVTILERKSNELKVEIEGEGHTFCNVLQKALLEDDTIEMAAYDISHPLISNPIVYVRTKGRRRPETALREAVEKIRRRSREFGTAFENALREWQQK
ncbi:MAG: DNA-directed RNA polymerase subunit L [Candidatus Bathyarchaeia archaeon]